jgi:hypothetical protein
MANSRMESEGGDGSMSLIGRLAKCTTCLPQRLPMAIRVLVRDRVREVGSRRQGQARHDGGRMLL